MYFFAGYLLCRLIDVVCLIVLLFIVVRTSACDCLGDHLQNDLEWWTVLNPTHVLSCLSVKHGLLTWKRKEKCKLDVLFIAGLVAYWPARIHDVALLDQYCPHVTSGRLAVCYSLRRSIFSSATAFTTAKLRWQQLRYRTINGKN